MVAPYVGGQRVEWEEVKRMMAAAAPGRVELRNESGELLGLVVPPTSSAGEDPDWVKAITPEEIERRLAGPFLTLDEFRKQARQE